MKEPHSDDVHEKPVVAANAVATPAVVNTAIGIGHDTSAPTATSKLQGAAGSSGAST